MQECRHLRLYVVERMYLYTAFLASELRPIEYCQTEVIVVESRYNAEYQVENFGLTFASCLIYHEVGKLLEDTVVALFVGFAKIASRHRFSHTKVVEFSAMSFSCHNQIS